MIDKLETIKKGTKLITKQLGFPTSAVAMESIYVSDIVRVL